MDERISWNWHSAAASVLAFGKTGHAKLLSKVEKCAVTDKADSFATPDSLLKFGNVFQEAVAKAMCNV